MATGVIGTALALTLTSALAGCSGSSDDNGDDGTKPDGTSATATQAPPGKYATLPEPCGAVATGTLKNLLPGAEAQESEGATASPYEGEPKVTYDTDRRVGCHWKSSTTLGTRHLSLDMERVVSYDPAISDDQQAELLFDEKAGQADIPSDGSPADEETSAEPDDPEQSEQSDGDGEGDGGNEDDAQSDASASPSSSAEGDDGESGPPTGDLSPRKLTGIGDSAYIDDQFKSDDSAPHRDITLVFRTANVIVTVSYDQWVNDERRLPDSAELQEKAQSVAEELAAFFADN